MSISSFPLLQAEETNFTFELQLFAEGQEKTEEATPKRRRDAREKGQVAKSTEINSAVIILAAFYFLSLNGGYMVDSLQDVMRYAFAEFSLKNFTVDTVHALALTLILAFLKIVMPLMLIIAIIGVLVNFFQVGFMFNPKLLLPDIKKINPLSGFARIFFSKTTLVNLAKSLLKVCVIGYFIVSFLQKQIPFLPTMTGNDLNMGIMFFGETVISLAYRVGAVMMVIAVFDYYFQWYSHNQKLKMSKQEVKEEYKQTEGHPLVKSKRRSKQRELAMRRMMQEVPKADVVVTNPTHFAIALKYEEGMPAPMVVAKGVDNVALRIRELAKDSNVAVVENKSLARTLYQAVEIGGYIPVELYQAVAEVLAYVYKLKKRLA